MVMHLLLVPQMKIYKTHMNTYGSPHTFHVVVHEIPILQLKKKRSRAKCHRHLSLAFTHTHTHTHNSLWQLVIKHDYTHTDKHTNAYANRIHKYTNYSYDSKVLTPMLPTGR